jgi:hypothetical protein
MSEDEDKLAIAYQKTADTTMQPALDLSLRGITTSTFDGTLAVNFQMTGDLEGDVTLNLSMTGQLENDGTGKVRRRTGSTTVTGTETSSGSGEFKVNVTL